MLSMSPRVEDGGGTDDGESLLQQQPQQQKVVRSIIPADPRITAAIPAELVQNVRNMLVAEGHLPLLSSRPSVNSPLDCEYGDECYLDCAFQPSGNLLEGLHGGLTDVDLTGNRLESLPPDLCSLTPLLRRLVLRDNLLSSLEPLAGLGELGWLDVYQNSLKSCGEVACLDSLTHLDFSFNSLRDMTGLEGLTRLEELYLVNNKIAVVTDKVSALTNLTLLELGSNRLRQVSGLENVFCLKSLWLGRNKICSLAGLEAHSNLTLLAVPSNRLTSMADLSSLSSTKLKELYLAHNAISAVCGLDRFTLSLQTLDLTGNALSSLQGLPILPEIEDLWAGSNEIASFEDIAQLKGCTQLQTLYLEHNPLQKNHLYTVNILALQSSLTQIDANFISRP